MFDEIHIFRSRIDGLETQLEAKERQLADSNRRLATKDRQLAAKDRQLAAKDRQLADKDARARQLQGSLGTTVDRITSNHHDERMALIGMLDEKMDTLINLHVQIVARLQQLETCTTTPSRGKRHGFALVRIPKADAGKYQLFLRWPGEVCSKTAGIPAADAIFAFTENGNPIDLRNNFAREANAYLRDNQDEAEAAGLVICCHRSEWEENDLFTIQDIEEAISRIIRLARIDVIAEYTEVHAAMKQYIAEARRRAVLANARRRRVHE